MGRSAKIVYLPNIKHIHAHARAHTYTYTYICIHTNTHTCTLSHNFVRRHTGSKKEALMTLLQIRKVPNYLFFLLPFSLLSSSFTLSHSYFPLLTFNQYAHQFLSHYYLTTITLLITFFMNYLITFFLPFPF